MYSLDSQNSVSLLGAVIDSKVGKLDSQFPSHVFESRCLASAAAAIVTRHYNAAIVGDRQILSLSTVEALSQVSLNIRGGFAEISNLPSSILRSLPDMADHCIQEVAVGLNMMAEELTSLSEAVASISEFVGFHIYNGTNRPTYFHDDHGMVVALRTMHGPATEFLANTDVLPGKAGRVFSKPGAQTFSPESDQILLFRGGVAIDGFTQGLVHRAPNYSGTDRIFIAAYGKLDRERIKKEASRFYNFGSQLQAISS